MHEISIWRQFSSNHSGSFTVVGRFANEDAAREAAEKLAAVIRRIDEWHADPANEAFFMQESLNNLRPITSAEAAIAQEFKIEWEDQGIDWYGDGHSTVRHLDRDVFYHVGDTWCIPDPIASLLKKFGGETFQHHEFGGPITTILVTLNCSFDSEESATRTSTLIRKWNDSFMDDPPWADYDDAYLFPGSAKLAQEGQNLRLELDSGVAALPAIVEWLQNQGARDINYTFELRNDAV